MMAESNGKRGKGNSPSPFAIHRSELYSIPMRTS